MAIVNISKFNLIFFPHKRNQLLHNLQQFKYIHFTNLTKDETFYAEGLHEVPPDKNIETIDEIVQKSDFIIQTLNEFEEKQGGLQEFKEGHPTYHLQELKEKASTINIHDTFAQTKQSIHTMESIQREITNIEDEIVQVKPWEPLEYPFKKLQRFSNCKVYICEIQNRLFARFKEEINTTTLTNYQIVNSDQQNTYFIVIAHQTESERVNEILLNTGVSEHSIKYEEMPKDIITQLHERKKTLEKQLNMEKNKLIALANSRLDETKLMYDYIMMEKNRLLATNNFLKTKSIMIMEGYIPTELHKEFKKTLKDTLGNEYYLQVKAASVDDSEVPILLKNSEFFEAFESVTEMYALPKYSEIDPTPWFSIFYAIFFGMMIGDAGYGLLMFILTFAILNIFSLRQRQKNFFKFFYYLSFSTILWGAIFGSFFGNVFELPALIDTNEQYNLLLILSIVLGVIHVFFALGVQAYVEIKRGKPLNALFDVGFWYMLLSGAIIFLLSLFLSILEPFKTLGLVIMIVGIFGILVTGGREQKSIGGKIAGGLYSLYGITSYIGDFVSYSRLMALALASGFIAYAINLMVGMLFNLGFLGIIVGIVIFIIGQGFNLFLSILSSYVHTLRLTYVEFFGKFYEGGGRPFQIFRNASKYIDVK